MKILGGTGLASRPQACFEKRFRGFQAFGFGSSYLGFSNYGLRVLGGFGMCGLRVWICRFRARDLGLRA